MGEVGDPHRRLKGVKKEKAKMDALIQNSVFQSVFGAGLLIAIPVYLFLAWAGFRKLFAYHGPKFTFHCPIRRKKVEEQVS